MITLKTNRLEISILWKYIYKKRAFIKNSFNGQNRYFISCLLLKSTFGHVR